MGKYKTRRKLHKRHKRKKTKRKKTKRKTFSKINYKKKGGAAAAEETSAEELYVANPFEKPDPDDEGRVSLYKWDWPDGYFVRWINDNKNTEVEFTPFGQDNSIQCYKDSYNKDKTECWKFRGPNSLFFTTKQDFERELKYRYSELKKNKKQEPTIEELRRIKNSMLGYETDGEQDIVEIKALGENIVAPCIDEQCEPCPKRGTKAIDCPGADHLAKVAAAQGDFPFSGVGYTIDIEKRGKETRYKPSYVGAPEFIIPQSRHVMVVPVEVHEGDEKLRELYAAA